MIAANTAYDKETYSSPYMAHTVYKDYMLRNIYEKTGISLIEYLELTPTESKLLLHSINVADKEKVDAEKAMLKNKKSLEG